MAPKKKQQEQIQKINQIKVGRFQFKTGNFWLTVCCFLMVLMLGMTGIISYTVYKVLDTYRDPIIEAVIRIHQIKFHPNQTPNQAPTDQQTNEQQIVIEQGSNQG